MSENKKEHGYGDETRRFLPIGLSGLSAAAGMEAANSKRAGKFLNKNGLSAVRKLSKSGLGSALVPMTAGMAGYAASKKVLGADIDTRAKATMIGSAGGVGGAALYEHFKKGVRTNNIKRSIAGTAGALLGGYASIAYSKGVAAKAKKKNGSKNSG